MIRVLIVGNGAREHAIASTIVRAEEAEAVFLDTNGFHIPGITSIDLGELSYPYMGLVKICKENCINLVVVGPEYYIADNIAKCLKDNNIPVFAPSANAARLESSKSFAHSFCSKHNIKVPKFRIFNKLDTDNINRYFAVSDYPLVVKEDGLAGGKGVAICHDFDQAVDVLKKILESDNSSTIVVEEFIHGQEFSFFAFVNSKEIIPLGCVKDYKKRFENNFGPNTGGMGSIYSQEILLPMFEDRVIREIMVPTVEALIIEDFDFRGVLFAGLILTDDSELYLLEYNVRFGDPETQSLMRVLEPDDVLISMLDCAENREFTLNGVGRNNELSVVSIVLSDCNYPDKNDNSYDHGTVIGIPLAMNLKGVEVFYGSICCDKNGSSTASDGRVLTVSCAAASLADARYTAYHACGLIDWKHKSYRKDIGFLG